MTKLGRTVVTEPLEPRIPRTRSLKVATALAALVALGLGSVAAPSAKAQSLTTLYSFCSQGGNSCSDGDHPFEGLVQASDGNFYGTMPQGGGPPYCYDSSSNLFGCGTVFQITPGGALTTLHMFCTQAGCADGAYPHAGLIQAGDGTLYGTTFYGGAHGVGTIFTVTPDGVLTTLYSFAGADGSNPAGVLFQGIDGNFYGTTYTGGPNPGLLGSGAGTIFKITPAGVLTTLYDFCSQSGCADGQLPVAGLVQGSDGNLYGVTVVGGTNNDPFQGGAGTVFRVSPSGAFMSLYSFCAQSGCADGYWPEGTLVQGSDGEFYGTTYQGGIPNGSGGTAFKITATGSLTTIHIFCMGSCADGLGPSAGLVQSGDGNFYGTTDGGGGNLCESGPPSCGTVFKMAAGGSVATLYSFCSQSGCPDGGGPSGGVTLGSDGNLYGMTFYGGANPGPEGHGAGTVFKLTLVPVASLSPARLTFSDQDVGTTSLPQIVTLSNTGNAPLTISSIGPPSGDFGVPSYNCPISPATLAVGASCTINVTFTPTGIGTRNGTLTITDDSNGVPGSQQAVSLTGTGINAKATLSPTSLSFGNQVINTTSAAKKVTLTSMGTTNLIVSSITITGTNASDFAQANNCPATMPPLSRCAINVTFTPSALGARIATLNINDNAANSPQTVALSGTGIMPVTLTPSTLAFGKQPQGIPSAAKNLTLTNNQSVALNISSITTNNPDYTQTNTCGGSLAAKAHCIISVTFEPSIIGTDNGTLSVADSASNSPQTASLTGTGIAQATVSPTSLTFAAQKVGTTSAAKTVTLTNNLSTALTFSGVTFTGAYPGDYASPTNTCGASVPAKSKCTISVTFTPTATGTRTATLNVSDSANNSPQTVSLTGTGK